MTTYLQHDDGMASNGEAVRFPSRESTGSAAPLTPSAPGAARGTGGANPSQAAGDPPPPRGAPGGGGAGGPTQEVLETSGTDFYDSQAISCADETEVPEVSGASETTASEILKLIKSLDVASMSLPQKKQLLELYAARQAWEAENMLLMYRPYPKQLEFHAAGKDQRERLLMAANQCMSPWSFIETPEGERLFGEFVHEPGAHVLALAGERECAVRVSRGILKGIEPAYRILLDTGRFFDCTRKHQVLTTEGWFSLDQLMSSVDGLHLTQTREDYLASYVWGGRLRDRPLHQDGGTGQAEPPAPGDVLERSRPVFDSEDAEARTPGHIRACLARGPLATADCDPSLLADLFSQFAGPAEPQSVLCTIESIRNVQLLVAESALRLQGRDANHPGPRHPDPDGPTPAPQQHHGAASRLERCISTHLDALRSLCVERLGPQGLGFLHDEQHTRMFFPFGHKHLIGDASIVAVIPIGFQPILDVQVPDWHNYRAAGVYHHNSGKTYSAAAEVAYHLTGLYPDWWQGKVFSYPPRGLAAGVTAQLVRDSMQVLLCGYPAKPLGHGMIPKKHIGADPIAARSITGAYDTIRVKHVAGGESVLYFRAYEQGREKVQAMTLDFCWLDEEPDADYYTEALTRTNVMFGPVFMTFTPLKGMSETVSRFLLHKQGHVTSMTIDDVGHYTAEQKAAIVAQYPPHEREARTRGVPALGSGRVYPVTEAQISVPAFPIPDHWPRLCGMDFGWQHPTAAVWVAHDRDADVVYVYDVYRASEQLIPAHAAAIRGRGDWIPVSWPHDGYSVRDANSGLQLRQQYAAHGVAMRPEHAQFVESGQVGETKTSRISTEAAIQEILTRMETGRLLVFSHLSDWFEEFRLYHRKEGVLVKERDDLMSATHKAIMDLRFAIVQPRKGHMIDHERRSDPFY